MEKSLALPVPSRGTAVVLNIAEEPKLGQTSAAPNNSRAYTCLVELHYHNPGLSNDGSPSTMRHHTWKGALYDATRMADTDLEDRGPFAEIYADDDTVRTRDKLVLRLQSLARASGYSHCEVRVYPYRGAMDYIPLFSGPLPAIWKAG
jgi:hypothetical protein